VRPSRTPLRDRWASARRRWCKPSALKPTLQRADSRERLHALQPQIDVNEARSPARVILAQSRGGLVRRVVRRWQWAGESVILGDQAVRSFLAPPLEQGTYGARRYVERKAQVRGGRTLPMTMPHGTPNRQRNGCRHGSTSLRVYPYVSMRDPESVQKNPRCCELGVAISGKPPRLETHSSAGTGSCAANQGCRYFRPIDPRGGNSAILEHACARQNCMSQLTADQYVA